MLILNQPIEKVIAESQQIEFSKVVIRKDSEGHFNASIMYTVKNENGEIVENASIDYDNGSFNDFWENFNSYEFLWQEIAKNRNISAGLIPPDIEDEIKNEPPEEDVV